VLVADQHQGKAVSKSLPHGKGNLEHPLGRYNLLLRLKAEQRWQNGSRWLRQAVQQ